MFLAERFQDMPPRVAQENRGVPSHVAPTERALVLGVDPITRFHLGTSFVESALGKTRKQEKVGRKFRPLARPVYHLALPEDHFLSRVAFGFSFFFRSMVCPFSPSNFRW